MRSRVNGLPGRRRHWRAPGVVHRGIRPRTHRREAHLPSSRLMWALVIPRRASFRLVITTVFPWPPHGFHRAALALTDQASRRDKTRGRRPGLVAISSDLICSHKQGPFRWFAPAGSGSDDLPFCNGDGGTQGGLWNQAH